MARGAEHPATTASTSADLSRTLLAVGWQVLGSVATLAAALWVSWRFGLAAQGEFGLAKSWFDAAAAIAALGLPQGLLHLQYRLKLPAALLLRWALRAGAVPALLVLAAAAWLQGAGHGLAAAVLASLPFAVAHLLARSVLLACRGAVVFGAVTALPALVVLAGVVAMGWAGRASGFSAVLLVAAAVAGLSGFTLAWRAAGDRVPGVVPRGELWRVSLQTWLQAALGALLAAGLLSTVARAGPDDAALGAASLGLHMYQLFAAAAGYMAPLWFDRLARQDRPVSRRVPGWARGAGFGALGLAAAGLAGSWAVPAWSSWLLPASLMLPAGVAAVGARLAGTVLLARSNYVELSLQALWRLLLAMALTWLALRWMPAAAAVALALLLVECATWSRAHSLTRAGAA